MYIHIYIYTHTHIQPVELKIEEANSPTTQQQCLEAHGTHDSYSHSNTDCQSSARDPSDHPSWHFLTLAAGILFDQNSPKFDQKSPAFNQTSPKDALNPIQRVLYFNLARNEFGHPAGMKEITIKIQEKLHREQRKFQSKKWEIEK